MLDALAETGTGERKLRVGRRALDKDAHASAEAVMHELREEAVRMGAGALEGTIEKAQRLLNGEPLSNFLGVPPPHGMESKVEKLGNAFLDKVGAAMEGVRAKSRDLKLPVVKGPLPEGTPR